MARFEITSPDGKRFEITAPEGATQEQALAYAQQQFAAQSAPAKAAPERQPDEADLLMGSPAVRFALGAASPFLGAAQLVSEAVGSKGVTEHLQRVEEMKRRGMTPAAELMRLKSGRDQLAKLKGYEIPIAAIDQRISELTKAASADPKEAGFDVAGLTGAVLSPAVLGATKIPAAATVLGRSGQGAAIGGSLGATAPVTDTDDYWAAKAVQTGSGTVLGGVIPPAIDAVRAGSRLARNIVDPMLPGGVKRSASRLLAEAAGTKRQQIEAELAADRVLVPGSQPTAAEAAAPAGSAEFSGLQRIAEQRTPTVYSDIAKAQEAARKGAIVGIGKDKAAVQAAEAARASEAGTLYGAARQQTVKADAALDTLLKRPSMEKALVRAAELAEESGQKFAVATAQPSRAVPSQIIGPNGKPASISQVPAKAAEYPVASLHHIKTALDDMVKNPERFGIGATEAQAIENTRRLYVGWLENKVPAYKVARTAYAKASKPINVMKVGQELEEALVKPIGEGERVGVFAGAVRDAPRTLKRATGQPRFEELEEVLDRGDYQTVKNVLADLARKAENDKLAKLGQGRASEITSAFSLPATGPLNQQYMIFKTVLGRISRGVTEKTLDEVATALQVPSSALKLLRMAPTAKRDAVIDAIIQRKLARGAIAAGTVMSAEGAQQ